MPPRVDPDPPGLPLILTRDEAISSGLTADQIRQRVRGGHWKAVATGVYLREPNIAAGLDVHERLRMEHVNRALGAQRARPDCVIGFGSAAVLLGLPLVSGPPALVQLLVPDGAWTGIRGGVRYRECRLSTGDVDPASGSFTVPSRTWIDIARTHRLPDALSVGDAARRADLITVKDTDWALTQLGSIRGVRLARRALHLLDGRRETPLESWSFACFVAWDIPLPLMQHDIHDDDGLIGRVDFYWPEHGLVGESDGRLKYDAPDALYEEKRREDRLRAKGLRIARWGWTDLARGGGDVRARLSSILFR
jgi:hypothetical protein